MLNHNNGWKLPSLNYPQVKPLLVGALHEPPPPEVDTAASETVRTAILPQAGQVISVGGFRLIFSMRFPHCLHLYSKIGTVKPYS